MHRFATVFTSLQRDAREQHSGTAHHVARMYLVSVFFFKRTAPAERFAPAVRLPLCPGYYAQAIMRKPLCLSSLNVVILDNRRILIKVLIYQRGKQHVYHHKLRNA